MYTWIDQQRLPWHIPVKSNSSNVSGRTPDKSNLLQNQSSMIDASLLLSNNQLLGIFGADPWISEVRINFGVHSEHPGAVSVVSSGLEYGVDHVVEN